VWEVIGAGLTVGATPPSVPGVIDPLYPPDLWFDDSTNSLKYWDQALNSWVGINCTVFASQLEYNALVDELTVVGAALGLIVPTNKIITTAGSPNTPPTTSQWQLLFIGVQTIIAHIRDTNTQSGTPATNAAYWIEAYNTIAAIVASGEDFKWCPTGTSSLHGMSTYFEIFDFVYTTCTHAKSWATSPNLALPNAVNFVLSSATAVPGQTITCTSTTSGATSWLWNFGNGVSSNLEGPHVLSYPNPGTYTITLTASNSTSVGTATDVLTSYAKPVSSFNTIGTVVGIPPLSVTFIDTSTNNPTTWAWTVTNHDTGAVVTTATTQNFQYSATTNGVYDISLVASNQAGASINTATTQVITTTSPIASFTRTPTAAVAQPPLTVNFTDTSSNSPTSWLWDFGDGATSTVQSPSHIYTTVGLFTVSLTVTNTVASNTVTVPACVQTVVAPIANFTYSGATSGATPLTLAFADTSANSPTSWLWDFGDGTTSSLQSPSHTYTTNGVFTVTLIATNAAGSSTKISSNIVSTQFTTSIVLSSDEQNIDVRSKLIAAGWNGISPVFGSLTINTGVVISANSTAQYALRTGGSLPVGSDFTIINYGYIVGMGGAGGNGNWQHDGGGGGKAVNWVVDIPTSSGGVGGPALGHDGTPYVLYKVRNYGVIAGGGGGGGGSYSPYQVSSPGGGGGQSGRTNSAGGYGWSYPGTFSGPGGAIVPSGHGNSGAGGSWGAGGAQGSAWPGDYVASNGGGGGTAVVGSGGFALPLGTWGTCYGTIA
jgi:PKD repeat protein